MSIKLETSGFYEWDEKPKAMLGVDTARLDECIEYYHAGGFCGWFGHSRFGFNQDNLDFLSRTADAKRLWFWDVALRNIDGVYALAELDFVGIHPKRPGIDYSRFPVLRHAHNHWNKSDTGLSASTITEYHLWHYKPTSKSFEGLEIPLGVTHLDLCWANPASLVGLPVLRKLKSLEIHRCRNLKDLSLLPRVAPNLLELLTTTSAKIDATAGVLDHPKLKAALISGKFVLGTARIGQGDGG
jgi:hypothetical protein